MLTATAESIIGDLPDLGLGISPQSNRASTSLQVSNAPRSLFPGTATEAISSANERRAEDLHLLPAHRRDRRVCGTLAASPDARLCKRHSGARREVGEQRVLAGDYPGNVPKRLAVLTADPPAETATMTIVEVDSNGATADPGSIRPALAQLAADNQSLGRPATAEPPAARACLRPSSR